MNRSVGCYLGQTDGFDPFMRANADRQVGARTGGLQDKRMQAILRAAGYAGSAGSTVGV